jgi:Txe/YoeB family toxin of toxin-antitoxin system
LHPNSEKTYFGGPEKIKNFGSESGIYSGCAIHVGQQIPYLIALCPFSMYQTDAISAVIEAVLNDPFSGIGKPEPLKHLGSNFWSRRIDQEHRLIYRVEKERILFLQARFHYGDR